MNSHALRRLQTILETSELALLGPAARTSRIPLSELNRGLDEAFLETKLNAGKEALIRSLLLLWHDHLDESHSLSQEIHNGDGSFLHGIMHRREPDYSNARYWFNRVGPHAVFPSIAARTGELLKGKGESALEKKLSPEGKWNAGAFVDACERAAGGKSDIIETLQQVQAIEFRVLLEHFCERTE